MGAGVGREADEACNIPVTIEAGNRSKDRLLVARVGRHVWFHWVGEVDDGHGVKGRVLSGQ